MRFRLSDDGATGPTWTPLIGTVLLLFALLSIASHVERLKTDERTRLPQLALARPPVALQASVTLDIVRPETGRTSEWTVVAFGRDMALEDIELELRRMARHRDADAPIIIRAQETVPHGIVQQVVEASQAAGFARFALKSLPEPRTESNEPRTE